ncbi:MAG: hypothetical protein WBF93_20575 [Pirellulales bacterium]
MQAESAESQSRPHGIDVVDQPPPPPRARPELIGRGRSGAVYREIDRQGQPFARKVFEGEKLSKLVLYVTTGAPNPYSWNANAVCAAVLRRKIMRALVRYWFGDRLDVPRSFGAAFSRRRRTHAISTELVDGRHLPLRCRWRDRSTDPIRDLTQEIMKPLQQHLQQAGFDGMVWQAGRGNPVAAGNFLLTGQTPAARRWSWIDLESGVPALFPLNPVALFRFYLPRSIAYRRPLFDDTDVSRLTAYLETHRQNIDDQLRPGTVDKLLGWARRLDRHQSEWKSLDRVQRGIQYYLVQGWIDDERAQWFEQNRRYWYLRLLDDACRKTGVAVLRKLDKIGQWYARMDFRQVARTGWRFMTSGTFRERLARRYTLRRIREWRQRRFLDRDSVKQLRRETKDNQCSACLTDTFVHLGLKPFVKAFVWWGLPILLVLGAVSQATAAFLFVATGALARTIYASLRSLQAVAKKQQLPWVAWLTGLFPIVGNAAFPLQLIYWSRDKRKGMGQFLVYDVMASVGRALPIWGGRNSLVEARLNRLPDILMCGRSFRRSMPVGGSHGVRASS